MSREHSLWGLQGLYWHYIGILLGLYWDSIGVILGFYWGYIGILLGLYWDSIGILLGLYWDYIGVLREFKGAFKGLRGFRRLFKGSGVRVFDGLSRGFQGFRVLGLRWPQSAMTISISSPHTLPRTYHISYIRTKALVQKRPCAKAGIHVRNIAIFFV